MQLGNDRLIALCQELIRIPSLSGQEEAVAMHIQQRMLDMGFDEVTIDKYGSVIGRIAGSRPGKAVLLDGHIDTVPVSDRDQWVIDPFGADIKDGNIYGRGTSDMKGSVAAMLIAAARFAQDTGKDFSGSVYVSCTVHEECFEGISSREVSGHVRPDYVIIGEATTGTLKIGQRGRAEIIVETQGVSCHSSNPEKGVNALLHMCAVIEEIGKIPEETHPMLGKGILVPTDIISSPYPGASVVPNSCKVTYDRRTLPGETPESVLLPIQQAIAAAQRRIPELNARAYLSCGEEACWTGEHISAERFFPAWVLNEQDELVQKALKGLHAAGIDAPLSHYSFCTNGSHFCGEAGIPTIGFGPSYEGSAHIANECIAISQLEMAAGGFYGIIRELMR